MTTATPASIAPEDKHPTTSRSGGMARAPAPSQGVKHDGGKRRFSLLPVGAVGAIVDVLEYGARKYDVDNWKRVPEARRRYYDAAMRHLTAWWEGERLDVESGLPHLAHAACCVVFLVALDVEPKLTVTPPSGE